MLDIHAAQVDYTEGHHYAHKAAQLETRAAKGWNNRVPGAAAAMPSSSTWIRCSNAFFEYINRR